MTNFFRIIANPLEIANVVIEQKIKEPNPSIYEAGGGSRSHLSRRILDRSYTVVVDISEEQLLKCDYANETIHDSIETWRGEGRFDLISCINVLEHVKSVEDSWQNFVQSLKPNGLLFLASPRKNSIQGIITRLTPHMFHVWYYKRIRGQKNAGKPGNAPFPVHFSRGIERKELFEFIQKRGLSIIFYIEYEGTHARMLYERHKSLYHIYITGISIINIITFGLFRLELSDFCLLAINKSDHKKLSV